MSRLWYKPDTKFSTPKACIKIHFNCPESSYSPEASVSTKIFTKLLVDYLNEYGAFSAPILNCLFRAVRILIICSIQFDALYKKVWPRFISNLPQFCFLCSCWGRAAYYAEVAGLSYKIQASAHGFQVRHAAGLVQYLTVCAHLWASHNRKWNDDFSTPDLCSVQKSSEVCSPIFARRLRYRHKEVQRSDIGTCLGFSL